MKIILIFVLYTMSPHIDPVIGHQPYNSWQACEVAKQAVLHKQEPNDIRTTAICVSSNELINYTRT